MRCPQCRHENDTGTKFCGECGARLAARCASCGASNPPSNKFCGECGASLAQEVGVQRFASPERYTPKHLAEQILTSKSELIMTIAEREKAKPKCPTCKGTKVRPQFIGFTAQASKKS